MSLIKTVKEKIAENASLKDIKHIIKRQKEGKALANFNRYAEELIIKKMSADGKSMSDIAGLTADKANHFELKWTEKRLAKVLGQKVPKAEKKAAEPAPAATPASPTPTAAPAEPAPAAPATEPVAEQEEGKKKRRKKRK